MKPAPFRYARPDTTEEAVALLTEHGDDAVLLAGGQSLMPLLALRLATPAVVIDLNGLTQLEYIRHDGERLRLGALARQRSVEMHPDLGQRCSLAAEAASLVGHVAIRNRGTVVGSMTHAHPAAEWPAVAVALSGEFEVLSTAGSRTIAAPDFFLSHFTTALAPGELVTEVRLTMPNGRVGSSFMELSRRDGDFAIVGVGALLQLSDDDRVQDARLALTGVGPTPVRLAAVERVLVGETCSTDLVAEAAEAAAAGLDPPADVHGSSGFRRSVARSLTARALSAAARRAGEQDG